MVSDIASYSDKNHATLENKGRDMAHSVVAKKTLTLTAASNSHAKIGIKVTRTAEISKEITLEKDDIVLDSYEEQGF